ncbi:extracellular solute-binding protein [Paenibacillus sp. J5C2022]|uniref:extracellular solute-binding protein n=1 Tax=Paenibacillus sp. J5C2022 TaxID=2977129 RepID=UPI00293EC4D3|nr:extracellular solute-binding protein [Paenibacillus sp. J5C2022]
MKKLSGVFLSTVLTASLLAGCSDSGNGNADQAGGNADNQSGQGAAVENFNETGYPIVNEKVKLTLMGQDVGMAKWEEMAAFKQMEEMTGIALEFRNSPTDSFETKKNLVFSSGEYPDMFYGANITLAEEVNYGSQGILIPLEDLIDQYAPNIKKLLDENPHIRKSITTPDGHIYSLPSINLEHMWITNPIWYNGHYLKALNMETPQTLDELHTYLKRVKEEDPNGNGQADEIPLTSTKLDDIRGWLLGTWGVYYEKDKEYYADDEGNVRFVPTQPGYREYLAFMNKLWAEGLLDQETFTQTNQQRQAKGKQNQLGMFRAYAASFVMGGDEPNSDHPLYQPVQSDFVEKPVFNRSSGISTGAFAITDKNPAPEATMRWIDYQYSYEGARLFSIGPEGTLWQYADKESKKKEWLEVPGGMKREDYRATLTPNFGIVVPTVSMEEINSGLKSEYDDWVKEQNEKLLEPIARIGYPIVYLLENEQEEVTTLMSDIRTYVTQMEAKFVTGQEPLDKWDDYVSTLKKMGADRIEEIYQAAYDRWNQNQ